MTEDKIAIERTFLYEIDARFPYADRASASDLIAKSRQISANAAFAVLEEISRPPRNATVSRDRQTELLAEWSAGFEHPLKSAVSDCAVALIAGEPLSLDASITLFGLIRQFPGQLAALNLAYFAADTETETNDAQVEALDSAIRHRWAANVI